MKDQERQAPEADRVRDLEVKDDEAGDVAGGKIKNPLRWGSKKARASANPLKWGRKES